MKLNDILSDSIFIFLPLKSSFWPHNPILLLYSIEFLLYEFFSRKSRNSNHKGKIENIIRIQAQTYFKFLLKLIFPVIENENYKYKWISECPLSRMFLFNYLMSYYFLSWIEYEKKGVHLDIPIEQILPHEIVLANLRVYEFLKSLTGTD